MIQNLPPWNFNNLKPSFNDLESATAVEMAYKLYGKNRELIDDYNKFEQNIKNEIETFKTSTNQDLECFKENITKICNDYIATMDMKIDCQDRKVADAIQYMKDNLVNTIKELNDNNELDHMIFEAISNVENEIKTRQNNYENRINKQIDSLASGSPLVANSIEGMKDTSRVYVNTTDGFWYYYNGSSWIAGGQYQTTQFPELEIDVDDIYFGYTGKQLYDYENATVRGYYNTTGFVPNEAMSGQYIKLKGETHITFSGPTTYNAFLDEAKNVISAHLNVAPRTTLEVPENAHYLFASTSTNSAPVFMVQEGTVVTPWEKYERHLDVKIDEYERKLKELNMKVYNKELGITTKSCSFIKEGNQLLDPNVSETGFVLMYNTGLYSAQENGKVAKFIVKPNEKITIKGRACHICLWDKDNSFITGYLIENSSDSKTFQTTSETKYITVSSADYGIDNDIMVNYGETALPYEKYKISIPHLNVAGIEKEPYQEGYIHFTVPVNQTIIDTSSTSNSVTDSEVIENVDCILKLPTSYTQTGLKTKLIMICHGAGMGTMESQESNWTATNGYNNLVNKFIENGYAVFDCHGINENTYDIWGSPLGVQTWRKAYDYIIKNYNVEENISIYGFSMGGLTALNLAFNDFQNIKCIALGSPVLDLEKAWKNSIATLYSNSITEYSDELVAGSNPIKNIITLNEKDYVFKKIPPIKIFYGGNEDGVSMPYVNKADSIKFINAIKNTNGIGHYREFENCGHEICYGENASCNTEILYWFNRFNH